MNIASFLVIKPPKSQTSEEVAYNFIDTFYIFEARFVLQGDSGREFANQITKNLIEI